MSVSAVPGKPRLRGWFHAVAFFVSIPAGIALVALADRTAARLTAAVYAFSLTAVFAASASYHRIGWSPAALRRMRQLDHSMIYVLIAGTYTPVCVLVLHEPWSLAVLAVVWSGAGAGIVLKLVRIERARVVTGFLYIGTGWLAIVVLPQLLGGLSPAASALMIAGGLLYTTGSIVLFRRRPDPSPTVFGYHEVWHALMVGAAACHYAMILLIVRSAA